MMNKIGYFFLCGVALLTSCVGRGTAVRIEDQRDSLATALEVKDSLLNEVFRAMNTIAENLTAIRTRENILALGDGDGVNRPAEQIGDDIAAIDRLLAQNRAKIASLEQSALQLRRANVQIEGLERMIGNLNAEIRTKDGEIARLKERLTSADMEVETLRTQVTEQSEQIERLADERQTLQIEVEDKTERLYTVRYVVGSQRELLDAQIIRKTGFIGRTMSVRENCNLDSFTKSDSRFLDEIPLGFRNVKLVTVHPEDSYRLEVDEEKRVRALEILDPDRFWESSKILVISYK